MKARKNKGKSKKKEKVRMKDKEILQEQQANKRLKLNVVRTIKRKKCKAKKLKKLKKKDVSQVALYLISLVIFILGLSYASVPLYQLFCQATGFGGTIQTYESTIMMEKTNKLKNTSLEQNIQEMAREEGTKEKSNISSKLKPITIYFNADISEGEQEFP